MNHLPDIAGVKTPSPIVIQVPRRTKINNPFLNFLCFSKNDFNSKLCQVSAVFATPYADSFSSVSCWFGSILSFACRQSNEYNAKVPPVAPIKQMFKFIERFLYFINGIYIYKPFSIPSPLSSADMTMKTYLRRAISVKVQKMKERTP